MTDVQDSINYILQFTWPMLAICLVVISSLRLAYLLINKKEFILYKEVTLLIMIIYVLCLFQIVTYQDMFDSAFGSNFVPFREIFRYSIFSKSFFKNVIGNMLLFMPFGILTTYYIKNDKWWVSLVLLLLASFTIELTQLAIGRVFDIDDILLNVIGGMIGFYLFKLGKYILDRLPNSINNRKNKDIGSIILIIVVFIVLYKVVF